MQGMLCCRIEIEVLLTEDTSCLSQKFVTQGVPIKALEAVA